MPVPFHNFQLNLRPCPPAQIVPKPFPSLEHVCHPTPFLQKNDGAGNEARTRDIKLGKLALYQLSYARINSPV
jgi:hypothetical protein